MSRVAEQSFKDLNLDAKFFEDMLVSRDAEEDYDIYIMENGVMPLVLQGLDALSRHVNKLATGTTMGCGSSKRPFNPLVWLAQYLLRNHPAYIRDHRTPMYSHLQELAAIERGRRALLRQKEEFEDMWKDLAEHGEFLEVGQFPVFFQRLDDMWNLEGSFFRKVPVEELLQDVERTDIGQITFVNFWVAFEALVDRSDIIRHSSFEEAQLKVEQAEMEFRHAQEEALRRELALAKVLEQRRSLEEQFETLSADVYINSELSSIMSKGAVINGLTESGGGPSLQGEHVQLILMLLRIWGCPVDGDDAGSVPQDEWDEKALDAWRRWIAESGPRGATPEVVDSNALKLLMDRDAFQAYLLHAQDTVLDEMENVRHTVEVRGVVEGELDELYVEALDEDTGEIIHLALPEAQAVEVRKRLEEGSLFAKVDLVAKRVLELVPPGGESP